MGKYDKIAWEYLIGNIGNEFGVAALMGNLFAESGIEPGNLQNTSNKSLGMTDEEYTLAVDKGIYTQFTSDRAGYGLAQWTSKGRKDALLKYAQQRGGSIGNIDIQLEFLYLELQSGYKTVLAGLKNAKNIKEASDLVLTKFEMPKDQSDAAKEKRAAYGKVYYDQFAKMDNKVPQTVAGHVQINYQVGNKYRPTVQSLRIRTKRSSDNPEKAATGTVIGTLGSKDEVKCLATAAVNGAIWMYIGRDNAKREQWICADTGKETYLG